MRNLILASSAIAALASALACRAVVAVPGPVLRARPAPHVVVVARPAPLLVAGHYR